MKKFASITALAGALLVTPMAFAGVDSSCHFHGNTPIKESVIAGCATAKKDALAASGQIETAWKSVQLGKAETIEGKKMKEWKLTFNNPAAKDAAKQTLYVFYTLSGNFIGANFTGQ